MDSGQPPPQDSDLAGVQEFNCQMWLDFHAKAQTLNGHRSLRSRSDED